MKMERNRQILLINRPNGEPRESDFTIIEQPLKRPGEGEMLIRLLYLSVDPWLRFFMSEVTPLIAPSPLNEVFGGEAVGEIVESNLANFKAGDIVKGSFGWQEYALSNGNHVERIMPDVSPITSVLGILGTSGLTAYFGLLEIGKPTAGETIVISGAAGAVGSTAGQIAKLLGCRVVGIAGSDRKAQFLLDELGFDAVVNYKTAADMTSALQEACPDGIDVYFDNVGGNVMDHVITLLNRYARIVVCGQISQYNDHSTAPRLNLPFEMWKKSAQLKGFMMHDYEQQFEVARSRLLQWLQEGKLHNVEHIIEGFENTPQALIDLFNGGNLGKQIVKIANLD